jgi:plastocyanin
MKKPIIAAAIAVALGAAACGGGNGAASTPSGSGATATTTATMSGSPSPSAGETSGETRLAMEDFVFQPAALKVASGASIQLENEGKSPHTFTIDGQGIDEQVAAGSNSTITVNLDPGTYDFYCKFHKGQGMTGTLTVSG